MGRPANDVGMAEVTRAHLLDHVRQAATAATDLAPMRASKYVELIEIRRVQLDFPPPRIARELVPHVPAPAIEKGTACGILAFVGQVGIFDQVRKAVAVGVKIVVMELVA